MSFSSSSQGKNNFAGPKDTRIHSALSSMQLSQRWHAQTRQPGGSAHKALRQRVAVPPARRALQPAVSEFAGLLPFDMHLILMDQSVFVCVAQRSASLLPITHPWFATQVPCQDCGVMQSTVKCDQSAVGLLELPAFCFALSRFDLKMKYI